jgi:hypothetical protein
MSSQADLYINKYNVISQTSFIIPEMAMLFRESDKKVYRKKIDSEYWTYCEYSNTVRNIKDRLEIMGYTIDKIKSNFNKDILIDVNELEDRIIDYSFDIKADSRKVKLLKNVGFKAWQNAFKYILKNNLNISHWIESEYKKGTPELVKYILNNIDYGTLYNYPGGDIYSIIRIFLESCEDDKIVRLDLSHLVNAGHYELNQTVCKDVIELAKQEYPLYEKIVILTEGSSDRRILESSLKILFPHLYDYYSFMNFEDSNAEGGASTLVKTIQAFTGSGITNRVVAIFDNDTAAKNAMRTLDKTKIPENIKIMQYPHIPIAMKYPTQGASGLSLLNINGLAGSIEIYLGRDILESNGKLTPIQWKGYDQSLKQYQGEIIEKNRIQKDYIEKSKKCIMNNKLIKETDWSGLSLIWTSIFRAFQS